MAVHQRRLSTVHSNSTEPHFKVFLVQQHQRDATAMIISANSVFARGNTFVHPEWTSDTEHLILDPGNCIASRLRSKCSICSYQLNIWYGLHCRSRILNWFLTGRGQCWACSPDLISCHGIALPPCCSFFKKIKLCQLGNLRGTFTTDSKCQETHKC